MKFYFINLISKEKIMNVFRPGTQFGRTKEKLKQIEEMDTLWKYLYLNEKNYVVFNNGMNNIKLTMNAVGRILSTVADDPDDFTTVRQVDIPEIFEIIKQLKKQESSFKGSSAIKSEWDRITAFVRMNISLNSEDSGFVF